MKQNVYYLNLNLFLININEMGIKNSLLPVLHDKQTGIITFLKEKKPPKRQSRFYRA